MFSGMFFIMREKKKIEIKFFKNNFIFLIGFLILVAAEMFVRFSGLSILNFMIYLLIPLIMTPIIYFY